MKRELMHRLMDRGGNAHLLRKRIDAAPFPVDMVLIPRKCLAQTHRFTLQTCACETASTMIERVHFALHGLKLAAGVSHLRIVFDVVEDDSIVSWRVVTRDPRVAHIIMFGRKRAVIFTSLEEHANELVLQRQRLKT